MELSRRLINAIGTAVVAVIVLGATLLMVQLFIGTSNTTAHAEEVAQSNQRTRVELVEMAHQEVMVPWLRHDVEGLRSQITEADELRDASALASVAATYSGARIVAITFGTRQVFATPTGAGIGDDGTPAGPQPTVGANTPALQLPVTFEVEVSSTAQASAFLEGLRRGPRLLQVVQAEATPTNNARRFTLTVDALIFSAKE